MTSTILIVCGDKRMTDLIKFSLVGLDMQIISAQTSQQAHQLVTQIVPNLVILSLHLPENASHNLMAFFRQHPRLHATPMVCIGRDSDDEEQSHASGCAAYICYNFDVREMRRVVIETITGAAR